MATEQCQVCQLKIAAPQPEFPFACVTHLEAFGPVMVDAIARDGEYELGLMNGLVIQFARARQYGQWLLLTGVTRVEPSGANYPNGLQVRGTDIVYAADLTEV